MGQPGTRRDMGKHTWSAFRDHSQDSKNGLYSPLLGDAPQANFNNVTPFAWAGLLSKLTFWWLNPLMRKGKEKTLEEKDLPKLSPTDRAESCKTAFIEALNKRKRDDQPTQSLFLSSLFLWQLKPILIAGIFALIKVLATSIGSLLLMAFIKVAEGKESFDHEGYALTAMLFLIKFLESLAERQWYFRMRLIGIQVRSMLSAVIYEKQLRISPAAKITSGEIVSYVTVDAYRIGEFPYWFHQMWTTSLQLCLALVVVYYCVGLAAIAAVLVVILTVIGNTPLMKLQHKHQTQFMKEQDRLLQATTEALSTMKILKLYAWETHFKRVIEFLREQEHKWLKAVQTTKGYYIILFWSSPVLVPIATFVACYFLGVSLNPSNVFAFLSTIRLIQEPIRFIPEVVATFIDARVALDRIAKFLEAPELQKRETMPIRNGKEVSGIPICIRSMGISWDACSQRPTLRNVNLKIKHGEKVAICGEVGAGKTTLLASILGEVPNINGSVQVHGKIAYVSQAAWIQTGTIQENILFGSAMDSKRYQNTLAKCSLIKDIEMLPFGDQTVIGEKGVNLSGGQRQRIQLARALYQNADIYLLDDPFSAVDAHTATHLFHEYVMDALSTKTVLLVTHQVDFLPEFGRILLMSEGEILKASSYNDLMHSNNDFSTFVNAHKDLGPMKSSKLTNSTKKEKSTALIDPKESINVGDQLIKKEEREIGDTGFRPYLQYLKHGKGFLYFSTSNFVHILFIIAQFAQNYWLAANLQNPRISKAELVIVYGALGLSLVVLLFLRSAFIVLLGLGASRSIFAILIRSLVRAPISFYESTPLGRILSRVSSDLSIVDLDMAVKLNITIGSTINTYFAFGVLAILAWEVLFVIIPMVYLTIVLQRYYFATAKELMRLDGITKSQVASHVAETTAGAMTVRAFGEETQFISKNYDLVDKNASATFHLFAVNEWFVQRLEIICAVVLSASAMFMTMLPHKYSQSGLIGMALSYGLSLNVFLAFSVQSQCLLANMAVSVERLEQYMHIPSEAPEIIEARRPSPVWPDVGQVEICNLKVRYRPNCPLVLRGISCVFEGGYKIGIVGRTGSGKTTLISSLFRVVEPAAGSIIIDGMDIGTIGLHDLRSHLGIIPQEPTLFVGSVRFNLDPLSEHSDKEIWEVLGKCQLREAVQEKPEGLDSLVVQDGSNWSMGQRQLFCLGRALLKRRRILVLDEATASIDNATDSTIQSIIRSEFADCTVITVAHRVPAVMDCTKVLGMSDGEVVEFDDPRKLLEEERSLFGRLVREYWSRTGNA